jgi:hypothetical protein
VPDALCARVPPALPAPQGKGNKVADASGVVAECETRLSVLPARLRERYLASLPLPALPAGRHQSTGIFSPDGAQSSTSARRLRTAGAALAGGEAAASGSPRSMTASPSMSRGWGARTAAVLGAGETSGDAGTPPTPRGGSGLGLTAPPALQASSSLRRGGGGLFGQLTLLASSSARWRAGRDGVAAAPRARESPALALQAAAATGGGSGARAPAPLLHLSVQAAGTAAAPAPAAVAEPASRPTPRGAEDGDAMAGHVVLGPAASAELWDRPSAASHDARSPPAPAVALSVAVEAPAAGRGAGANGAGGAGAPAPAAARLQLSS